MKPFALALALVLVAVLAFQRFSLSRLSAENAQLSATHRTAAQLSTTFAGAASPAAVSAEIASLQAQNGELPKLRNEVHQLREQTAELQQLQAENQRLRSLASQGGNSRAELPPLLAGLPFLSKESLTNAGLATPLATMQTYFWSAREVNEPAWTACLAPKLAQYVSAHGTNDLFRRFVKQNASVTGYVIGEQQRESASRVQLSVWGLVASQFAESGRIGFQLHLQKIAEEWKLEQ